VLASVSHGSQSDLYDLLTPETSFPFLAAADPGVQFSRNCTGVAATVRIANAFTTRLFSTYVLFVCLFLIGIVENRVMIDYDNNTVFITLLIITDDSLPRGILSVTGKTYFFQYKTVLKIFLGGKKKHFSRYTLEENKLKIARVTK